MGRLRSARLAWQQQSVSSWKLQHGATTYYVRRGNGSTWRAYRGTEWLRRKTDGTLITATSAAYCMIAVEDWIDGTK